MFPTESRDRGEPPQRPGAATATAIAGKPEAGSELRFQRCRWCGTPVFRRSLCPTCASTDLKWELSAGTGVVVRRNIPAALSTSIITMDEGFSLVCRVSGTPPEAVSAGARVHIVDAYAPDRQDLPVVELSSPQPPAGPWR
jgi:uncharacterized protein